MTEAHMDVKIRKIGQSWHVVYRDAVYRAEHIMASYDKLEEAIRAWPVADVEDAAMRNPNTPSTSLDPMARRFGCNRGRD
jgi:hypothetical protein